MEQPTPSVPEEEDSEQVGILSGFKDGAGVEDRGKPRWCEALSPIFASDWCFTLAGTCTGSKFHGSFIRVLLRFHQSLHDHGCAELGQPDHDPLESLWRAGKEPEEARRLQSMLEVSHAQAVLDFPGSGIEFHPEAAIWGAILLFRAAFLTSFREIQGSDIAALLQGVPMPDGANPSAHFSADLSLRHWPVLYRMARARSEDDPLVKSIHELAKSFPLSSLGMNIGIQSDSPVLRHAGLRQFFAERALKLADHACLSIPEIAEFVRWKLGAYSATLDRGLLPSSTES